MVDLLCIQHDRVPLGDQRIVLGGVGNGLFRLKTALAVDHALEQVELLFLLVDLQGNQVTTLLSQLAQATVSAQLPLVQGDLLLGHRSL